MSLETLNNWTKVVLEEYAVDARDFARLSTEERTRWMNLVKSNDQRVNFCYYFYQALTTTQLCLWVINWAYVYKYGLNLALLWVMPLVVTEKNIILYLVMGMITVLVFDKPHQSGQIVLNIVIKSLSVLAGSYINYKVVAFRKQELQQRVNE